jgi:hypothetical protein
MTDFQESPAKQTIRSLIAGACEDLQRSGLTYLGMPGRQATDVRNLGRLVENAICVDRSASVLEEMRRNLATLPLKARQFFHGNMWTYLREQYPGETLLADITFLDFCGGGIQKDDPFGTEIAGIRSYFAKHAHASNRAFVLAWTYMPHDRGATTYQNALAKIVTDDHLMSIITRSTGLALRSISTRVVLWQSLKEHGMLASVYHHAVYKRSMNTVIIVFSKGVDRSCRTRLEAADGILQEPAYLYDEKSIVPKPLPLLGI